jgi:hypothetical protein
MTGMVTCPSGMYETIKTLKLESGINFDLYSISNPSSSLVNVAQVTEVLVIFPTVRPTLSPQMVPFLSGTLTKSQRCLGPASLV